MADQTIAIAVLVCNRVCIVVSATPPGDPPGSAIINSWRLLRCTSLMLASEARDRQLYSGSLMSHQEARPSSFSPKSLRRSLAVAPLSVDDLS